MFESAKLLSLFLAFAPPVFLAYIITKWAFSQSKFSSFAPFMIGGFLSVLFVHFWSLIFPNFQDLLFITGLFVKWGIDIDTGSERAITLLFYSTIQIGLLEECMKALSILSIYFIQGERKHDVTSIALHAIMVSIGFSAAENLQYFTSSKEIIYMKRLLTSLPSHITCGVIMGYFLALSSLHKKRRSTLISLGIICAFIFHGMYDYIVYSTNEWKMTMYLQKTVLHFNPTYIVTLVGIAISFLLLRNIKNLASKYG